MKKFSNVSNSSTNSDLSKEEREYQELKVGIMKLMDNCLSIRSYGSARAELLNGALAISGKEMFAEALINLIDGKSLNDQVNTLESLKSENRDWDSIDSKIDRLYNNINENKLSSKMTLHINKIKTFINLYGNDNRFDSMLEKYSMRVKNIEDAHLRSVVANRMIKDTNSNYSREQLSKISDKFLNRAKDLGFENGRN